MAAHKSPTLLTADVYLHIKYYAIPLNHNITTLDYVRVRLSLSLFYTAGILQQIENWLENLFFYLF